ncbi:MAG: ABC transporter permease [Deltaproteobacteria bacterium]|nr:ABC transporter permease [Deltaproteobacteria bacterium]
MTFRFLGYKFGRLIASLFFIFLLNFMLPRLMPGSPVFTLLGPDVIGLSQKDYQTLEQELGLDRSIWRQLASHLRSVMNGDLGYSYYYHRPVSSVVFQHVKPTLLLLLPSVVLSSIMAAFLGAVSGWRPGSKWDLIMTPAFLLIYALPLFLVAMVALEIFSFRLNLFPLGGLHSAVQGGGVWGSLADRAHHLALPLAVLSFSSTAIKYLVMRNSVAEDRFKDYVTYARVKGLKERRILFVHIFRNASLPLLSLVGLHFAFLLSGSLLVEIVFSINGMGSLIYEAAMNRDYPILQGCFLLLTAVVLLVNTLVDSLYEILDPRVRK